MNREGGFRRGRIPKLRWWIVGLIFLGTVLNYVARNTLAVLAPELKIELGMSTAQYSYVVGTFLISYAIMQPVCGYVIDRVGLRKGFAFFAAAWSIANILHALAGSWIELSLFRMLLGGTEAALVPAGMKAITAWFPMKERSVATGWFSAGTAFGSAIAPPLIFAITLFGSWHWAFVVTGIVGLGWAALWLFFYDAPDRHRAITAAERAHILTGRVIAPAGAADVRAIVTSGRFWRIAIPRFFVDPAWQTLNFWVPLYLATTHHMDLSRIAMLAWLPFLAADLGAVFAGYLSPFLVRRFGITVITSRVAGISLGAMLMIGPGCIGLSASPYVAIALFCVGGFAHAMISVLHTTLSTDIFPQRDVATAVGFVGQIGWVGGAVSTLAIGQVADTIGFAPIFACLSVFDLLAAAILIAGLRHLRPAEQEPVA
ncbi:MFS transporter [Sphingomonas fuzhouensis]|uniref:MFS transporter n=1 Tax=Sphingomonas fuzhouensis TaxID=3106033 RepID=UPI002AFF6051|nr:MFS transporter [Sphingomonas sp. SGZ-02]